MEQCINAGRVRMDGQMKLIQCKLVAAATGYGNVFVPESRCAGCSQTDDGTSHASKVIDSSLWMRVSKDWDKAADPKCETCGGSTISVEEALKLIRQRRGVAKASEAVIYAVKNGMPPETAIQLSQKVLSEVV